VAVSVLVILLVAIVQERSRALAAIIATMPLDGAARHVGRVLGEGRRSTADGGVRALDVVGAAASLAFALGGVSPSRGSSPSPAGWSIAALAPWIGGRPR
jgi:hypothetical protein